MVTAQSTTRKMAESTTKIGRKDYRQAAFGGSIIASRSVTEFYHRNMIHFALLLYLKKAIGKK